MTKLNLKLNPSTPFALVLSGVLLLLGPAGVPAQAAPAQASSLLNQTAQGPARAAALASQAYNGGRIVFVSARDFRSQIYAMDPDGANQVNLSANSDQDSGPAVSPDSQHIAFISTRDGNQDLYVMDANGGNQTRLTSTPGDEGFPSWSPDGTRIVVQYAPTPGGAPNELDVIAFPGGGRTVLFQTSSDLAGPDWSPLGDRIAFYWGGLHEGIYTLPPSGGAPTSTGISGQHPAWSPDGTKLAYVHFEPGPTSGIGVATPNGTGWTFTFVSPGYRLDDHPRWSPDGRRIIYDSTVMGFQQLYVAMADGSDQSNYLNLSASNATDWLANWSMVGSAPPALFGNDVVYQSGGLAGPSQIHLYNMVTGQTSMVVQGNDLRLAGMTGQWIVYQQVNAFGGYDIYAYDTVAGLSQLISAQSPLANQNRPVLYGPYVMWRQTSADFSQITGRFYRYDLTQGATTDLNVGSYGERYSRYAAGDGQLALIDEYDNVRLYNLDTGATTELGQTPVLLGGVAGNFVTGLERDSGGGGNELAVTYAISPSVRAVYGTGADDPPLIDGDMLSWSAGGTLYRQNMIEDMSPMTVTTGADAFGMDSTVTTWLDANGAWSPSQLDIPPLYTGLEQVDGDINFSLPATTTAATNAVGANPPAGGVDTKWVARVQSGELCDVVRPSSGPAKCFMTFQAGEELQAGEWDLLTGQSGGAVLQFRDGSTMIVSGGTYLQLRPYYPTEFQKIQEVLYSAFTSVDINSFQQAAQQYQQDGNTSSTDDYGQPTGVNLTAVQNDLTALKNAAKVLVYAARKYEQNHYISKGFARGPTYLRTTETMLEHVAGHAERFNGLLSALAPVLSAGKAFNLGYYVNSLDDAFQDYMDNIVGRAYTAPDGSIVYYPLDPFSNSYPNRAEILLRMMLHDGRICFNEFNWHAKFQSDGSFVLVSGSCGVLWSKYDVARHIGAADGQTLRQRFLAPLMLNSLQLVNDTISIFVPGEAQLILSLMTANQVPRTIALKRGHIRYVQDIDRARQRHPRVDTFPGVQVSTWGTAFEAYVYDDGTGTFLAQDGMPVLSNYGDSPDMYGAQAQDGVIPLSGPPGSGPLPFPNRLEARRPLITTFFPNEFDAVTPDRFHFEIGFSAPMSTTSVTAFGSLNVTNASGGTYVAGALGSLPGSWDALSATLTLTPATMPSPGTYALTLTLPSSVVSAEGLTVQGGPTFTTTFTVNPQIGPAGGQVTTADGVQLNVPPGALTAATSIQVHATYAISVTSGWSSGDGLAYVFGPAGLQFNAPVTLTLPVNPLRPNTAVFHWTGSSWENLGGVPGPDGHSLIVTINHFSIYASFSPGLFPSTYLPMVLR